MRRVRPTAAVRGLRIRPQWSARLIGWPSFSHARVAALIGGSALGLWAGFSVPFWADGPTMPQWTTTAGIPPVVHALPGIVTVLAGLLYGVRVGLVTAGAISLLVGGMMTATSGRPWTAQDGYNLAGLVVLFLALGAGTGLVGRLRRREYATMAVANRELDRARSVLAALYESGKVITSELDLNRLIERLLQLLDEMFGYTHPAIYLMNEDEQEPRLYLAGCRNLQLPRGMLISPDEGVVGQVAGTGRPVRLDTVTPECGYVPGIQGCRSAAAVPIHLKNRVIGVLSAERRRAHAFSDEDVRVLQAVADQAAVAVNNARLMALVSHLAETDGLTELFNHRHLLQQLELEVERARRYGRPLALVLLDIDDFKQFNDRYGHLAGDEILRAVAQLIRSHVRQSDLAARYGGEEFAIVLPETGLSGALTLAGRIQTAVPALVNLLPAAEGGPPPALSVSAGVAVFPDHAGTWRELLARADEACYRAKRSGKNRVEVMPAAAR